MHLDMHFQASVTGRPGRPVFSARGKGKRRAPALTSEWLGGSRWMFVPPFWGECVRGS